LYLGFPSSRWRALDRLLKSIICTKTISRIKDLKPNCPTMIKQRHKSRNNKWFSGQHEEKINKIQNKNRKMK